MTSEEAIAWIKTHLCPDTEAETRCDHNKAMRLAISALENIDRITAERDAAYNDLSHNCKSCAKRHGILDALDRLKDGYCEEWEWRGVQNETN